MQLVDYLFERLGKVAYKRTAYTAPVELVDGYARLLQKAALDAYLAEFVFDKNKFFYAVSLFNQLFDKRGFTRAQKTRKHVYFYHLIDLAYTQYNSLSILYA